MILLLLAIAGCVLAVGPAVLFAKNWRLYCAPPISSPDVVEQDESVAMARQFVGSALRTTTSPIPAIVAGSKSLTLEGDFCAGDEMVRSADPTGISGERAISVLIPARDEERSIYAAVRAVLASRRVELEVIVLDDHSTDRTAHIVKEIATEDSRVHLATAPPLPAGWCGKQHACHVLAGLASHDLLVFIDADVRLKPDGLARAVCFLQSSGAELVSGIPHQETETILEKLLIPLIHFVLLGFLPFGRMRSSTHPAYGAGCGQLFVTYANSYARAGGHSSIRESLHDGITLPRAFRRAGLKTDLFDATQVADCRMYSTAGETWRGLAKNATEAMASPGAIVPWTTLLFIGQVLPLVLLGLCIARHGLAHIPAIAMLSTIALASSLAVRLALAFRFRQSKLGALLHPVGIVLLIAIQWWALIRKLLKRPSSWKGRGYLQVTGAAG